MRSDMYTEDRGPETGFPYRDPSADPRPHFALDDARGAPPSCWSVLLLAAVTVTIAWVASTAWREHRLAVAVAHLPPAVQLQTYQHVRDELTNLCPADRARLDDRCRGEASFLVAFPQCDDDCRALAMPYLGGGSAPR